MKIEANRISISLFVVFWGVVSLAIGRTARSTEPSVIETVPKSTVERTAESPSLVQFGVIDALLTGDYEGRISTGEFLKFGDFGIGTMDKIDGELVVLDGIPYQIKSDGRVSLPSNDETIPFGSVLFFSPQVVCSIDRSIDADGLIRLMNERVADSNLPVAVWLEGTFSQVRTRSAYRQEKPFRPLAEVMKTQPEFDLGTVSGDVVGFYLPAFVKGLNVPGLHLHLIDDEKSTGGHLLNFVMESGTIRFCSVDRFEVVLPRKSNEIDFERDRSDELRQVESGVTERR